MQNIVIHPVIRVMTLVMLALVVVRADFKQMLPVLVVLFFLYIFKIDRKARARGARMLFRMRWFFLSIVLIYGWLTPVPVSGPVSDWTWMMPDITGLIAGSKQLLALAVIMLTVNLLLYFSSREELLQAIYWLAKPVTLFGISRERLAVRLLLVMDQAVNVRAQLAQIRTADTDQVSAKPWWRLRYSGLPVLMAELLNNTVRSATGNGGTVITFHPSPAPPLYQWGLPLLILPMILLLPV